MSVIDVLPNGVGLFDVRSGRHVRPKCHASELLLFMAHTCQLETDRGILGDHLIIPQSQRRNQSVAYRDRGSR